MYTISKEQIEYLMTWADVPDAYKEVQAMLQGLLAQPEQLSKDALVDIICQHTSLTYHCTRTWQAWGGWDNDSG